METEQGDAGLEKDVSWYGLASSEAVSLEKLTSNTNSSSSPKELISVLRWTMLSLLEPLRKSTDTGFEVTLKKGRV